MSVLLRSMLVLSVAGLLMVGCGKKEEAAEDLIKRRPEVILERAIKGMLPKNRLGRKMIGKLFVYAGDKHFHTAQQPKELKF